MGMSIAEAPHQFHVLAVDDSIIDRKLIERLLKTSSYQVTSVDSGSKALEFLGLMNNTSSTDDDDEDDEEEDRDSSASASPSNENDAEVNLIITDYCMPGMTGYDLLRRIKESKSLRDIPVVIMSSENVPSRINRCLEEGAQEFFLKPVQLSDVNKLKPHLLRKGIRSSSSNQGDYDDHDDDIVEIKNVNNSKRKGEEEDFDSPDKTRTRYSGLEFVQ